MFEISLTDKIMLTKGSLVTPIPVQYIPKKIYTRFMLQCALLLLYNGLNDVGKCIAYIHREPSRNNVAQAGFI